MGRSDGGKLHHSGSNLAPADRAPRDLPLVQAHPAPAWADLAAMGSTMTARGGSGTHGGSEVDATTAGSERGGPGLT